MGRIYFLMGKSASGKDTMYEKLLERFSLKKVVPYTTRPLRENEKNGKQYFFVSDEDYLEKEKKNQIIESRVYETVYGPWRYFTVDDGQIDLSLETDYLMIGTLESYQSIKKYFGQEVVVPLYLEVEDGVRLQRAMDREKKQLNSSYDEMCRRFLADQQDFSDERLEECGIHIKYKNENLEECLKEIGEVISSNKVFPDDRR